jgi:F-type H+-transporting ATPase subunit gamma
METVEQLGRRLETFGKLSVIVRTMKTLAAVNIRQYDRAVHSLADYHRTVERGLQALLRQGALPTFRPRKLQRVGAVIFGSDHGLCGRFNEDLADYARARLAEAAGDGESPLVITVGARARALLEHSQLSLAAELAVPGSAARITNTVRRILLEVDAWQNEGRAQRIYLIYNRPAGNRYHPTGVQLLPVDLDRFRSLEERRWPSRSLPMHTMRSERLLATLLQQYIFVSLFRACAESLAAENASRLAAMQLAEKTLTDRRQELQGEFRRRRQESITSELLDVVAGFEAAEQKRGQSPFSA